MRANWRHRMETAANGKAVEWRERIEAQRGSGRSIRSWCREHSLPEHTFYWWRTRLGLSPAARKRPRRHGKAIRFAEVVIPGSPMIDPIRLNLPGGRELILPASMPIESVVTLIRALE